jgi:hypothetical protein
MPYDILIKNGTVIDSTAGPARRADAGIARLALLLCLIALLRSAWAQYPTKPIHIVVPFPAGGVTDNVGRIIGQRLTEVVGQPIIFENKPGADGIIAASAVGAGTARRLHALSWNCHCHVGCSGSAQEAAIRSARGFQSDLVAR